MMKNEAVVIEQQSSEPPISLGKSPMSRTLVYRTNKEFDKCAELLRNILTVQESRRNSKSSAGIEINRKSQASPPNSHNTTTNNNNNSSRIKKNNAKISSTKSFIKTNLNSGTDKVERRSSFSPSKSLLSSTGVSTPAEDQTLIKTRSSPTKSRKHSTRSPSPTPIHHSRLTSPSKTTPLIGNKTRQKSSPSPIRYSQHYLNLRRRSRPNPRQQDLIRSSSCGDLPSSNLMHKQQTRYVIDQFVQHLTRIRTISKQIRTRTTTNTLTDPESFRLWNDLETSLASALTYANEDIQFQLSFEPLRDEMILLRKQLQTTNHHLRQFDHRRPDENYVHQLKTNEKTSIEYSQLLMENHELKSKCDFLQEKLENVERNNIRLIQRWTQQDLRFHAERTDEITTENRYLLREEILLLKQKLYHVYDDLATLFNRNHSLEISNAEQKQQIFFYKQQFNDLQQSAQHLLHDLDKRSIEEKIKRFLSQLVDLHATVPSNSTFHPSHATPTKSNPSSHFFETPHKATGPPSSIPPATSRSRPTPLTAPTKLRPKSLFVTPTILNDATALSKLQQTRHYSNHDPLTLSPSSSSTICDAESILTTTSSSSTSLSQQQDKRMTLYTSLPTLNHLNNIELTTNGSDTRSLDHTTCFHPNHNESGAELDQISDLTSKMFSSDDEDVEEDGGIGGSGTSTSISSALPSDAERLIQL